MTTLRRSSRLAAIANPEESIAKTRKSVTASQDGPLKKKKKSKTSKPAPKKATEGTLPRTRELELREEHRHIVSVMGIDEAGRGPLAGPVVAAAAIVPVELNGIGDSKKVTAAQREELYQQLTTHDDVIWSIAVVDAKQIDEINILQATMQAMRMAANGVVNSVSQDYEQVETISATREGCYVVGPKDRSSLKPKSVYALVDGNRVPPDMPCDAEFMIKGDGREFSIGAASILAKVARDQLMAAYDEIYPDFDLKQNKGYPTAAHMEAVRKHGASPIHRRTFAPLKHMKFDEKGRVIEGPEESK